MRERAVLLFVHLPKSGLCTYVFFETTAVGLSLRSNVSKLRSVAEAMAGPIKKKGRERESFMVAYWQVPWRLS